VPRERVAGRAAVVDYDVHGLVGVRLVDPTRSDVLAVDKKLGPLRGSLSREPDIVLRFVDRLPMAGLRHVTLGTNGFTDDGFFVLRSNQKQVRVKLGFDGLGARCEMVCESGLRSIPLLMAVLNLTMLRKDCVSLHASAFQYQGRGILVTGWAKGGKTETLLSFAAQGARYLGDEWILLAGDGQTMYGIPETIRLQDWHIRSLPHVRQHLGWRKLLLFWLVRRIESLAKVFPGGLLRQAMPAIKRRVNVRLPPKTIFGENFGPFVGHPEKVFLTLSHDDPGISVEPVDPGLIARRMISSIRFEQLPFLEQQLAFAFAFPDRKNPFLDRVHELQYEILERALRGKEAYMVRHPYPLSFQELFERMRPYCE
jgi:hypothetical protein